MSELRVDYRLRVSEGVRVHGKTAHDVATCFDARVPLLPKP